MLPNATVPRRGYSGGCSVAAAADRRGSLGSLSRCSNHCEIQGNGGIGLHVRGNPIFSQIISMLKQYPAHILSAVVGHISKHDLKCVQIKNILSNMSVLSGV